MEAGRRAGVKTCAVTYGYGDRREMSRFQPDYWIDDLRELLDHGLDRRESTGVSLLDRVH
jgi:phosphoglycolate phosphatase-like HAD superfamily hydrolase